MIQQRRAYRRAPGPFEGSWHGVSGNHAGRIYNLSTNGCFIEWPSQLPAGEPVRVELKLPRERLISVRGEVVANPSASGFGVRFVNLTTEHQEVLTRTVQALLQ